MADGGLHRTAYGTNPHSLSSSAIDSATASGITEREPEISLRSPFPREEREFDISKRGLRNYFMSLDPVEQQKIRENPKLLYLLGGKIKRQMRKNKFKMV